MTEAAKDTTVLAGLDTTEIAKDTTVLAKDTTVLSYHPIEENTKENTKRKYIKKIQKRRIIKEIHTFTETVFEKKVLRRKNRSYN